MAGRAKSLSFLLLFLCAQQLAAEPDADPSARLLIEKVQEAFVKVLSAPLSSTEAQCNADLATLANTSYTQAIPLPSGEKMYFSTQDVFLDSLGKPSSGIFQGDLVFTGSYDECFGIVPPSGSNLSMQYCLTPVYLINPANLEPYLPFLFTEGFCLPESCNVTEVVSVVNTLVGEFVYVVVGGNSTCTGSAKPAMSTGAIVMIVVSSFFVFMVIAGTLFDCLEISFKEMAGERESITLKRGILTVEADPDSSSIQAEKTPLLRNRKPSAVSRFVPFLRDLLLSFSLYKTLPAILTTYQPPAAITSINGIRTISMFWVILAHVLYWLFISQGFKNPLDTETKFAPRWTAQPIMNGYFAVDSFFFLSGLLVSYLTLRDMSRRKGQFPFVYYYVHRFLRLTPTYAFLLFCYWYLTMYLADGPIYQMATGPNSTAQQNCVKYWWTNLIYINNFYPEKFVDECMGWTWYLANDMQFYVITPLVIVPLFMWFPAGIAAISLLLVGSFAATGFVAGYYRLSANPFNFLFSNVTASADFPDVSTEIYGKPYARIAPYLVGIVLGYIFYKDYRPVFKKPFNWSLYFFMWCVAAVLCISTVYGLHKDFNGDPFSMAENVSYHMLARFAWGVGLALVVFACHYGYGGAINRFLSMPIWVPLGRFTFNAYLIHPIVLTVLFMSQRYPLYYTDVNIAMYGVASIVLSYGAAGIVCVFVEFPLSNVEIAVFKLFGLSRRESVRQGSKQQTRLEKSGLNSLKL